MKKALPVLAVVLISLLMFWAIRLWWKDERLPGRWVLFLLVIVGCSGILLEFRTLFGRDAGVAMLVVFMAMKLLELKSQRDAVVVVVLGYFLLLTHYFYSQSIPTGLWLLFALWLREAWELPGIDHDVIEAALGMLAPDGGAKINLPGDRHLRRKAKRMWVE